MQKTRKHALDSQDVPPSKRARKGEPQPQLTPLGSAVRQVPRILVDLIPEWLPLGDLCNLVDAFAYAYMAGQGIRSVSRAFLQKHVVDPTTSDEPIVVLHSLASLLFLRKYNLYSDTVVYLVDLHKKEDFEYWHMLVHDTSVDNVHPTFDSWFAGEYLTGGPEADALIRLSKAVDELDDKNPFVSHVAQLAMYASYSMVAPWWGVKDTSKLSDKERLFVHALQKSKCGTMHGFGHRQSGVSQSNWTMDDIDQICNLLVTPLSTESIRVICTSFLSSIPKDGWPFGLDWPRVKPLLNHVQPSPRDYFLVNFSACPGDGLLRVIAEVYGPRLLEGVCMHISTLRRWMENERFQVGSANIAHSLRWDVDQPSGMCTISKAGKSAFFTDKAMMEQVCLQSNWIGIMRLDEKDKETCLDCVARWMVNELGKLTSIHCDYTCRWTARLDERIQSDVFSRIRGLCDQDSTGILQQKCAQAMRVWNDTVDSCTDSEEEEGSDESPTQSDLDFIASSDEED